ncbi:MAG: tetratricopeptide repeat protein [Spartobacteria bacterium]|nr:tetratricopeptide repeat protein [Spartobacteria bacterium]
MRRVIILLVVGVLVLGGLLIGCGKEPGQREYERGVRALERGNSVRARALFEGSINKRPGSSENARTYNYLGIACWRLGQLAEAVEAFEESRRANPDFMAPLYNLGVLHYQMGDVYQASALLEETSLMDGRDPRPLEYLAYIHRNNQDWIQARSALYEALGWRPQSARILTTIALVELETEGPEAALLHLSRALEQDPQYAPALYNLGVIYRDRINDPDQAAGYFEQFLAVAPDSEYAQDAKNFMAVYRPLPRETIPAEVVEVIESSPTLEPTPRATPRQTPVQVVEATPVRTPAPTPTPTPTPVQAAATREPTPVQVAATREPTPAMLIAQAQQTLERGDSQNALNLVLQAADIYRREGQRREQGQVLKQASEICFDQARAHYAYGQFLADEDRPKEALVAFKQAATLSPDWSAAHEALAENAVKAGEYDAALIAYRRAIELDEQNPDLLWNLAWLYEEKLDFPERAEQTYYTFTMRFPGDPRVLKARGKIRIQPPKPTPTPVPEVVGQPPSDEVAAQDIPARQLRIAPPMRKNTRDAARAYNRGTGYQAREDWDQAIYYYKQAVEHDNTFAQAYYNLGTAYRMRGNLELAKDACLRAVRLEPDMVNARYNLALIYWELKQYNEAEEHARKVVELQPDHPYAHYLLGYIYSRNPASRDRAKHHFQMFITLAPTDPGAASVREWLRNH